MGVSRSLSLSPTVCVFEFVDVFSCRKFFSSFRHRLHEIVMCVFKELQMKALTYKLRLLYSSHFMYTDFSSSLFPLVFKSQNTRSHTLNDLHCDRHRNVLDLKRESARVQTYSNRVRVRVCMCRNNEFHSTFFLLSYLFLSCHFNSWRFHHLFKSVFLWNETLAYASA